MKCNDCKSHKIKTKRNYPFGKNSRPRTKYLYCRVCKSTDLIKTKIWGNKGLWCSLVASVLWKHLVISSNLINPIDCIRGLMA